MNTKAVLHPLLLFAFAHPLTAAPQDRLKIEGIVGGDRVVVMIDARSSTGAGGCTNDRIFRTTGELDLPNLRSSAGCNSDIAIFSARNSMLLETAVSTWTDSPGDVHTATLLPITDVPVKIWIADAAADVESRARRDVARANVLYKKNKVGVRFVASFVHVPAATAAVINDGIAVTAGGDPECQNLAAVQGSGYYRPNRLNVYYVDIAFTGRNCAILKTPADCASAPTYARGDANITYIGTSANRASLAHEFGHAFGLRPSPCGGHTNPGGAALPGFGPNNIMWGGGDGNRDQFTLGQVFRMNTQRDQWGGTMLIKNGLRPGPGRSCPLNRANAKCPALNRN